jgi:hypothetical protein
LNLRSNRGVTDDARFGKSEEEMQPRDQTDHVAILSLMMVGLLARRMKELGQLDEETAKHLHRLVRSVRVHAKASGIDDLNVLFDNIDRSLS